ncbi:cation diffusion facilitator family transporter [Eikenella sp. Marseille-P7795]|uniref:cation diffusion facilitator family transporter n=1 Tax=Eikenella sp. Marseille-P7795 TaxID=2866577 RepID=UPI001CE47C95|nr:cation diffusion facilitator family transporter [Eikenella sp. Marseille-P7795]
MPNKPLPGHSHHHDHAHDHAHSHIPQNRQILALSFAVITGYMVVEFLGGWYFNSLALMADAGHMANDSLSLLLALLALFLSARRQKWLALANGASLVLVAAMILREAAERWAAPAEMLALPMLAVACTGLLVNLFVAWLMMKGDHANLNVKAAYLHVLADLFGSVVAIVSGLAAWLLGWQWVDAVASVLLSLLVLKSGLGVVRQAWRELGA